MLFSSLLCSVFLKKMFFGWFQYVILCRLKFTLLDITLFWSVFSRIRIVTKIIGWKFALLPSTCCMRSRYSLRCINKDFSSVYRHLYSLICMFSLRHVQNRRKGFFFFAHTIVVAVMDIETPFPPPITSPPPLLSSGNCFVTLVISCSKELTP